MPTAKVDILPTGSGPMTGDLVLCTGMPRSGSTWSFNVCMNLCEGAYPESTVSGLYAENLRSVLSEPIADHLVIKCHNVDEFGVEIIRQRRCSVVYTYRDPPEAIASMMAFIGAPFEVALRAIKASLEFMTFQSSCGRALLISYGELTSDPQSAIRRIASHLGLAVDDNAIVRADRCSSRAAAGEIIARFQDFSDDEIYCDQQYRYHRRTLIHHNHLTGGGATWQSSLTAAQVERIRCETRPWAYLFDG